MKVRRALWLSALTLTLGSITVSACSSDPDTIIIYVEGGAPDAGKRDARPTIIDDSGDDLPLGCEPSPVPAFTFRAPPAYQGFCSDTDITNFLTGCVFDEGSQELCKAAVDSLSDACGECIYGGFNADPAAPLVQYTDNTPVYANSGTCMANIVNNPQDECAVAFGQVETCAYAACIPPCAGQSDQAKQACYDKAIGTICTQGLQTFDSTKCRTSYTNKTYGFCLTGENPDAGGKPLNNLEYYTLVTKLACGTNPRGDAGTQPQDSGPPDTGTPDTGVPDSGTPDADAGPVDSGAADADADAP